MSDVSKQVEYLRYEMATQKLLLETALNEIKELKHVYAELLESKTHNVSPSSTDDAGSWIDHDGKGSSREENPFLDERQCAFSLTEMARKSRAQMFGEELLREEPRSKGRKRASKSFSTNSKKIPKVLNLPFIPTETLFDTPGIEWMMETYKHDHRYPNIFYSKGSSVSFQQIVISIRKDADLGEKLRDIWGRIPTESGAQWLWYFRKNFLARLSDTNKTTLFDEGTPYADLKRDYNISHMSTNKLVFGSWYGVDHEEISSKPFEEAKKILKYCFFKIPLVLMKGSVQRDRQCEIHHVHPLFLLASRLHGIDFNLEAHVVSSVIN